MQQPAVTRKKWSMLPDCPAPRQVGSPVCSYHSRSHDATVPTRNGTAELVLAGEYDASNSARIAHDVERLCQSGIRRVRIDLAAVTFIDAATIGALLEARRRALALGSVVVLSSVRGLPLRVLRLVNVDAVLIEGGAFDG